MTISENVNSNPRRKSTIIGFSILLGIVLLAVSLYLFGRTGLVKVLIGFVVFVLVAGIIGLIVMIVIKLLYPPKRDMVAVVNNRIMQGAELRKPDNKVKVFLQGDRRDFERKYIGDLAGITRTILNPEYRPATKAEIDQKDERLKEINDKKVIVLGEAKEFFFLTIKTSGMFSPKKIVGVMREDLSNPNMSEIYIKDTTLNPPFGGIYYLGKYDNMTHVIEMRLADYVKRYSLEDFLREFKVIIDDAIQSSPSHQKGIENKGMAERIAEVGEEK